MKFLRWPVAPTDATPTQRRNFSNAQIDALGVGLGLGAGPFLPVFLTRLGATGFQVGLLTAMPGITGLFLSIVAGRFLESRRNIVPWYTGGRLLNISAYTLTGLVPFIVSEAYIVPAVLLIWAAVTVPQAVTAVAFTVVMNAVAGAKGRYALMSRRWSIIGLTKAVTVAIAGQVLDRLGFPFNYQLVFIFFSLGGLISCYGSRRIDLPRVAPAPRDAGLSLRQYLQEYIDLVRTERPFTSFVVKRFVYFSGATLAAPLFPLYYVREVQATDAWIGIISMAQVAVTLLGYTFWARQSAKRGARFVLLSTALGLVLYPVLVAFTHRVQFIALYAAMAGVFQAGLSLVFFDELMKTVPPDRSPTFVSLAVSVQHLATVFAPLLGTLVADRVGLQGALIVSAILRLIGFGLFALGKETSQSARTEGVTAT